VISILPKRSSGTTLHNFAVGMVPVPSAVLTSQSGVSEENLPPKPNADPIEQLVNGDMKIDNPAPIEYVGSGEYDVPRSPMRKTHSRSGSVRVNGVKREKVNQSLVLEKYQDADGEHLISVAPEDSISDSLKLDEKERPRTRKDGSHELVSGRRAGAGWEQSG
jgi:hypothetical protein